MDGLVSLVKATPLMPEVREILLPGERAWRIQQAQQISGIPVSEPVAADLLALARRLGVTAPASLHSSSPDCTP